MISSITSERERRIWYRRAIGKVDSSFESERYCSHRCARSGIATANNPTVNACLRSVSLNLRIYLTLHQKYTLIDPSAGRPRNQVLQLIYNFYRFLPALEDIYQDFGRNYKLARLSQE